ncbi:M57 family metalloprotease [Chryseobacterium sp. SL1]|uniref:M57 family metalloprotease n=1 Tax=Chryseobacterium sp. SL1 TaxID=2995159 RepID=UPI00227410F2|nr:M57 family metalloprotease [Chryseobacterium sp. SL1]MCY1660902.1 M57 family metalloprotease [Chryseobacterium sp. SL1]
MNKNSLWAIALLLCSVLFLSSCANNDDVVSNQETITISNLAISDPEIKKEIEFMREKKIITESLYQQWIKSSKGFVLDESDVLIDKQGTKRHDQFYRIYTPLSQESLGKGITTDEIMLDRKNVQDMMKQSNQTLSSRMKRTPYMFGSAGGTITCRVFTQNGNGYTAVTKEWKNALIAAVTIWNTQGLKVKFKVVDATNTNIVGGYVNVYMQDAYNIVPIATAWPPSSPGYFGERIRINLFPQYFADVNGKITALVHELGHIVGFHHTDEFANNTSVFNTAVTCNEGWLGDSFMYGSIPYDKIFVDFSSCDKQNLKYYWGY